MEKMAFQIPEAAAASGLSRSKLYVEIKEGRLRSVLVGGRRLILKADLESFFKAVSGSAK